MENRFKQGDIVRHFKREMLDREERETNKYLYEIIGVATHSESREPMMVYKPLYDDGGMFVRPLEMFLSEVDHEKYPDVKQRYRLEKVNTVSAKLDSEYNGEEILAMDRADKAEELFRKGYNCSQSVFMAFAEEAGMTEKEAAELASPFGAGFGKMREVCGAVSGMTMIAGNLRGYSDPKDHEGKKELYSLIQKMCAEFQSREGSIICRELLGLEKGQDLAEPAVRTEEYYQSRPCIRACRTAAEIAEKYLLKESQKEEE